MKARDNGGSAVSVRAKRSNQVGFGRSLFTQTLFRTNPDGMQSSGRLRYIIHNRGIWRAMIRIDPAGLTKVRLLHMLRQLHQTQPLPGLTSGIDYRWMGLLSICFSSSDMAALFILFFEEGSPSSEAVS